MKRLTITVLVAGLFAGSLFASENNTMMGMDKEKCHNIVQNLKPK